MALPQICFSQYSIKGQVKTKNGGDHLPFVSVSILETRQGQTSTEHGVFDFQNLKSGTYTLKFSYLSKLEKIIKVDLKENKYLEIALEDDPKMLDEVVVSGNMKEMSKTESAIPIDIILPSFFCKKSNS